MAPGLAVERRSIGALPGPDTAVYVMDTLGELGLAYRLGSVGLVGGSLVPHGGQNPLEPAKLGCPILLGPWTGNFTEVVDRLLSAGGAVRLESAEAGALAAVGLPEGMSRMLSLRLVVGSTTDSRAGSWETW
jgi:3-deoxy-D-manno-octulosonic-acid transferase